MPAEPTPKASSSKRRPAQSKRGAIACVRCKERKAKTPNELFLLEYVAQLENRVAQLEIELAKYRPEGEHVVDHSQTQAAAIESLTQQYPPEAWYTAQSSQGATTSPIAGPSQPRADIEADTTARTAVESGGKVELEGNEDEGNDDLAYGLGRLTLSGSGEPVYVGASSGVNWARVCATALRGPGSAPDGASSLSRFNYLMPPESSSIESALSYEQHHPIPALPSPALATRYLEAAYQHIQARYAFLDWPTVRNWHENREAVVKRPLWGAGRGKDFRRSMAAFTLWLLYGYGARLTEDENLEGAVSHEVYHNVAVACLSNVANHTSIATVQAELLLTIYSFRHPQPEISVWQTAGLALRTAIQVGLHRKARSKAERERNPLAYEMKKRTFWTLYTIDRMLALQLGRPSGIQDRDIDIEMPLNVDVEVTDAKVVFELQNRQIEVGRSKAREDEYAQGYDKITSMTSAIHNIRLNRLKQLIQDAIYRLDQPVEQKNSISSTDQAIPEVDDLLTRLHAWQSASPPLPPGRSSLPLLSRPQQDMEYHNCVQMLLRPVISNRAGTGSQRYLSRCFDSAAASCEIQWETLDAPSLSYRLSNWALYRLFLSGLTLLHLASSPSTAVRVDLSRAHSALRRCLGSLGVYVRHLPAMKGYEDVFKELVAGWEAKLTGSSQQAPVRLPGEMSSTSHARIPSGQMQSSGYGGPSSAGISNAASTASVSPPNPGLSMRSVPAAELSDPLKWLESLSSGSYEYSTGQAPPALHIPLHPAQDQIQVPYEPYFGMDVNSSPTRPANSNALPRHPHSHHQPIPRQSTQTEHMTFGQPLHMQGTTSQAVSHPSTSDLFGQLGGMHLAYGQGGSYLASNGATAVPSFDGDLGLVTSTRDGNGVPPPSVEQLAPAPGGGVRDDFFSLLASLGVDMTESLGDSLPPIAEDHLWTSDWSRTTPSHPHQTSTSGAETSGIFGDFLDHSGQATAGQAQDDNLDWMDEWQDPQEGLGMSMDNTDDSWMFPFP